MVSDLFPYQVAAIREVLAALLKFLSTLLVLPTGTGKTRCLAHIAEHYAPKGPVLLLVNSIPLIAQAEEEIRKWTSLTIGIEQGERTCVGRPMPQVVIAMTQSLSQPDRLARFPANTFSLVLVDEGHHGVASTYRAILDRFKVPRVFVTATPNRLDGRGLGEVCESVAFVYELCDAIRDGYLVPIIAKRVWVETLDFSKVRHLGDDFDPRELEQIMLEERHLHAVVAPTLQYAGKRKTLIFGAGVAHSYALAAILNRGVPPNAPPIAVALDGSVDKKVIAETLRAYKRGAFQFLVGCDLFREGFNEPSIACVVAARVTQSPSAHCQMVGRGTRLFPGKENLLVLDFAGNTQHPLVSTVDLLGGELDDRVRDLAQKKANDGVAVLDALDQARAEVEGEDRRRRELAVEEARRRPIQAQAVSRLEDVTNQAFLFYDFNPKTARRNGVPMSEKQVAALLNLGLKRTDISGLDRAQASDLMKKVIERIEGDRCTPAQARLLDRYGISAKNMSKRGASKVIDAIKKNGWKPSPSQPRKPSLPPAPKLPAPPPKPPTGPHRPDPLAP